MGGRRAAIEDGMTYRQVERALRRMGFRVLRHSGDHAIWGMGPLRVAVRQGHPTERVPRNTIRQMALQARGEQPWSWGGGVVHRGKGDPMGERTGLERLRELGREQEERSWSSVGKVRGRLMLQIADQIEREHEVDYRARFDRDVVRNALCDMERHVSGVEGADDSPVALWARELRSALAAKPIDPANDVSVSVYDLLPADERAAIAWVREHGGLSHVKDICHDFRSVVERLGIEWSEGELHGLMDALDRRLMPEGMEWPAFEDGETVRIGDEIQTNVGCITVEAIEFARLYPPTPRDWTVSLKDGEEDTYSTSFSPGGCVKRPAPKVYDAEGAVIREKRDAWWVCEGDDRGVHAERLRVEAIGPDGLIECSPYNGGTWVHLEPSELYVNKPVLSADGRPLREGEKVSNDRGDRFTVVKVDHERGIFSARNERTGTVTIGLSSARFTHERPDSYQRLYMDMAGQGQGNSIGFGEFVRRAQELAEHPPMREERRDGR